MNKKHLMIGGGLVLAIAGTFGYLKRKEIKTYLTNLKGKKLTTTYHVKNEDSGDIMFSYDEARKKLDRVRYEEELVKQNTIVEGLVVDPLETETKHDWHTYGDVTRREITRYEKINGIEYDPETERVETFRGTDGFEKTYVVKIGDIDLPLKADKRPVKDVIESVEDFAVQIYTMRKNNVHDRLMAQMRSTYGPNTPERLDYFLASLLETAEVTDKNLRKRMVFLFRHKWEPNMFDSTQESMFELLQQTRREHLTYESEFSNWVSVGEVVLMMAENASVDTNFKYTTEDYLQFFVNNIGLDYSENEAYIHDTLISYMHHDRGAVPNTIGGIGLFGISDADYESTTNLTGEYQHFINYVINDPEYVLPVNRIMEG